MGVLLAFYAGDADPIGAAFTASGFAQLRSGASARAYVDFSLHLSSDDLDTLSEVIAKHVGQPPLLLNDHLLRKVGGTGETSEAWEVDSAWVQLVAAANQADAAALAQEWIAILASYYQEALEVSPEAVDAIEQLIQLCRLAVKDNLAVVHTWAF